MGLDRERRSFDADGGVVAFSEMYGGGAFSCGFDVVDFVDDVGALPNVAWGATVVGGAVVVEVFVGDST